MNKFLIHIMIYMMSVISYIYLNNINNISPLSMCSIFIKFICCNRSLKDTDIVSEPSNISVPFEDIKRVGSSIEHVVEETLNPEKNKVKSIVSFFDKNTSKEKIT